MRKTARLLSAYSILFIILILISSLFVKPVQDILGTNTQNSLEGVVKAATDDSDFEYGIYVKNLKTGEDYLLNPDKQFEAASLYKLWVMGAVYQKVQNGDLDLNDSIATDIKDINRRFGIASDEAELREGHLQYSLKSAMEQMITISHNYASMMLIEKVGNKFINQFISTSGLKSSNMKVPIKTTASDIGLYLEKMYKGELVSPEYSKEMLETLKRQKINDRLPKYLPPGTVFAHKTGNLGYFENDGGIVFSPKGDYIIVVLTKSSAPLQARENIAQISKAVYEYFDK